MSADNRLCLMEWGGGYQWYAWHGSCSANYHEPPAYAHCFSSRREALAWADKEAERITILEGGITLIGREEQELALCEVIDDTRRRLGNLRTKGCQYPQWKDTGALE